MNFSYLLFVFSVFIFFAQSNHFITFSIASDNCSSCAFLTDNIFVVGTKSGNLVFSDLSKKRVILNFQCKKTEIRLIRSLSGGRIIYCTDNKFSIFDLFSKKIELDHSVPSKIISISVTKDRKKIIAGCADGYIREIELESGKEIFKIRPFFNSLNPIPSDIAISSSGRFYGISFNRVLRPEDMNIHVFDSEKKKWIFENRSDSPFVQSICFDQKNEGELVFSKSRKVLSKINVIKKEEIKGNNNDDVGLVFPSPVFLIKSSAVGDLYLTCIDSSFFHVKEKAKLVFKLSQPVGITEISISPNGKLVSFVCFGSKVSRNVFIFDVEKSEFLGEIPPEIENLRGK